MRTETQQALIRTVLAQIKTKSTDMSERDVVVDAGRYYDPARLAREEQVLFRRYPLLVAHKSELTNRGDFITHDPSGVPILLIVGDDGKLRAFLNICRHRGTRLVAAPEGNVRGVITCPYHAWSYRPDGQLHHLPQAECFPTLDRATSGLVELPLEVVHGMVFVTPTGMTAAPSMHAALGSLDEDFPGFHLDTQVVFARRTWKRSLNWKIALDGFFEIYHVRVLHRESLSQLFFDYAAIVEPIGNNLRLIAPRRSIESLADLPEEAWDLRAHAGIVYYLFPNTVIMLQPDHIALFTFYPQGTDTTVIDQVMLVAEPPKSEKAQRHFEKVLEGVVRVFEEDFSTGEKIQLGVRHNPGVHFGRHEKGLAAIHAALDRALHPAAHPIFEIR